MKILITGSSGFVGKHLVKKLSSRNEIVEYDLIHKQDILDKNLLSKKMKGVDVVIHLAAFISAIESWEKPEDYIIDNALGTLSVIRCAVESEVKKIIFFSSAAVKAKPLTPYAVSKISAEEIVKLYSNKINSIIIRPENIYGLGQKANYGYVIHNFIKAMHSGGKIEIFGTGNQSRDFIYIDDVVSVTEKLLNIDIESGSIVSLGTGKGTKIIDLAKLVMKVMDKKVDIDFLEKRNEPFKSIADTNVLSGLKIEHDKFIGVTSGIKKLLCSYK